MLTIFKASAGVFNK
jgi:hypothetical protein